MDDKIKKMLQMEGPLTSKDITLRMGKRKVKDIQKILNKLLKWC